VKAGARLSYLDRFRAELNREGEEHDAFVRLIVAERIAKAALLILLALALIVLGRTGYLLSWATAAHKELLLSADASFVSTLIDRFLVYIGFFQHQTALGLVIILYALLEGTEGIGLFFRRRWAEYLTVFATGLLIPYEIYEVAHRVTLFRAGGLALNVAVVGYLAWRKKLFVGV